MIICDSQYEECKELNLLVSFFLLFHKPGSQIGILTKNRDRNKILTLYFKDRFVGCKTELEKFYFQFNKNSLDTNSSSLVH